MAIVVEEKSKGGVGFFGVLIWLLVLVLVAIAGYYIFFANPDLIELQVPAGLERTQQLSQLSLDPKEVLESPGFKNLQSYITTDPQGVFGRVNPFLPI